jgi:WD40 repeat protein
LYIKKKLQGLSSMSESKIEKELDLYLNFCPHGGNVKCIKLGKKSGLFATGGLDGKTLVWTVPHLRANLKPYKSLKGHSCPVTTLSFDLGEDYLASGGEDGSLWMWNMKNSEG